ncbi:MAG TPA: ribosome-associated translation inhibitor RaiA [Bacteroidales bacterium]|jgi:putative sigma-54 modulation protein|nr:MAG: ribosome hibernation promoting factor HPF [Bacteroidetes bacterium ADurb.Bin416]HBL72228.1 ribosome-associated translation inhibitor RaiA [Bacteroidales bacterium]
MGISIQSIHFDATVALEKFIEKKVKKLEVFYGDILETEVILKVIKPETAMNKEALVKVRISGSELFASKVSDTFEEAVDTSLEAIQKQLIRIKEKGRPK